MTGGGQEKQALWWQKGIIYQIYPRSFKDSNGDGIGDLAGITEKLGYVSRTLCVDAIWLSPFYPSPMADFGYDVSDYTDVSPLFGTLQDFDRLMTEAHGQNVKVIVDFVINHTSNQHPWFEESRSSRDNPKRDWYVWRDAKPDGSRPNNWLSVFGGPAWTWDEGTNQYYLHAFLREQPDLNWRNPEVKAAMLDVLRFWLDRGVDGFRIDAAHLIMKDPELRDNPPNTGGTALGHKVMGEFDTQLHLYDRGHPDIHPAFRDIRRLLDEYSAEQPRMAVGEIHIFDWTDWASYYGVQADELHMPFNFGLLKCPWTAQTVRQVVDAVEAAVPPGSWPNFVLGNHDESRVASRIGETAARMGMLLLLTLRGTPTVYYGDELGMKDVPIPPERVQDPWGKNVAGLGRDPARTPMQWDPGPNAGFCPEGVEPWLPVADDYREKNVAVESEQPASMLNLTRALIALRRESSALSIGSYRPIDEAPEDCFVYLREMGEERRLVALNFADNERTVQLSSLGFGSGTVLVSTHMDREGERVDLSKFRLRGNEGCVIALS